MNKITQAMKYQIEDFEKAKVRIHEELKIFKKECIMIKAGIESYLKKGGVRDNITALQDEVEQLEHDISKIDLGLIHE